MSYWNMKQTLMDLKIRNERLKREVLEDLLIKLKKMNEED